MAEIHLAKLYELAKAAALARHRAARVHQDLVPPYSPLEKAALVLMREDYPEEVNEAGELTEAGQVYWHRRGVGYVETIRAVLTAIREPDEAMVKAGVLAPNYLEDQSSKRGCANIYTAMIDAILVGSE